MQKSKTEFCIKLQKNKDGNVQVRDVKNLRNKSLIYVHAMLTTYIY